MENVAHLGPIRFPLTLMMFGLLGDEGTIGTVRRKKIVCQFAQGHLLIYVTSRPETAT